MAEKPFSKIFVLYDFSDTAQAALAWAKGVGNAFGSHLKAIHAIPDWINIGHTGDLKSLVLAELKEEIEDPAIALEVLEGRVVEKLTEAIEKETPDLVVVGTQGRTGLVHVLLGSVAEKIVRHSQAPVAAVRPPASWPPRTMILPLAFDASAEEALWFASEWKQAVPSLAIHAIHVIAPPMPMSLSPDIVADLPGFDLQEAKRLSETRLKELLSRHLKLDIIPHVAVGHPADSICETSRRQKADIVLIPTHGRTGMSRFFLGSVAEHVVRYAPCSVLSFAPGKEKVV